MFTKRIQRRMRVLGVLAGGFMLASGCINTLASLPICGAVVPTTVCTPQDQLLLFYQFLKVPDFSIDPSCTIPFGCSGPGDSQFPFGGSPPTAPTGGGGSGTGGAGGGGGGAGGGGGI